MTDITSTILEGYPRSKKELLVSAEQFKCFCSIMKLMHWLKLCPVAYMYENHNALGHGYLKILEHLIFSLLSISSE